MRRSPLRLATFLALVLALSPVAGAGAGSGDSQSHHSQHDWACRVYPIGVKASVLAAAGAGSVIDLTENAPAGQEGWLSWTGDGTERALVTSLTPPGDDWRYKNPNDRSDRVLSAGDWVSARPGSVSSSKVRDALAKLIGRRIVVPVWDRTRSGSHFAYRVSGFAGVEIVSSDLRHGNRIMAKHFRQSWCGTPASPPIAQPARGSTAEDQPTTIVLTGSTRMPASTLVYRVTQPASGVATLIGQPTCTRTDGRQPGDHPHAGDKDKKLTCSATVSYRPAANFFGSDAFTFTVFDGQATSVPATVSITVSAENDPPLAGADSLTVPGGGPFQVNPASLLVNDTPGPTNEADQDLQVKAVAASADTHGTVSLADGTITYTPDAGFSGVASFTYRVCDNGTTNGQPDPRCADGVVSVMVAQTANQPPVADAKKIAAVEDTARSLTLSGSDPDGDSITYAVAAPAHGTLSGTAPNLTYTPAANYFGPDSFTFTVFDGHATSAPATVTIRMSEVNDPPTTGADTVSTTVGHPVEVTVESLLANDTAGPPNEITQTLTITEVNATADTHGTVTLADGTITYIPDAGFSGTASFTYTVCDDGTTDFYLDVKCTDGVVTVNVTGVNQPPVGADQSLSVAEDESLPISLTGSDPDSDPITYAVVAPGHGTFSGTAPDLTYTPAANYFGPDSFTFTVFDGQATSVPATVSIDVTPVNDPPTAGADSLSAPGGKPIGVNAASLLANDTTGPSNEATQTLVVTDAFAAANTHGTVALARGTITYIPDVGFSGAASFTSTVCDNGTTDAQPDPKCADEIVSLTVTPAPNEPPAAEAATVAAAEDTAVSFALTGDDPDGDLIAFTVAAPVHGTLSGTAPDLTYTPNADYFGPDAFTFTVYDGQATSVPATVSIVVSEVNDPPTAGADSIAAPGGVSFSMNAAALLANDTAGPVNEANQLLLVTAVAGSAATHGSVKLAAGTITYTRDDGFTGPATFGYTVCDNGTTDAHSDSKCTDAGTVTVNVTAPDEPPTASAQSVSVAEDASLAISLAGSDPEGEPITYAVTPPAHGTLTGTAPALTYRPDTDYFGPDAFMFTTHDALSSSQPATVTITVTEVNDAPVLGSDFATLGGAGTLPPPQQPSCRQPCGVVYGDPHLLTFDGAGYDAQAVGEVIAAKSTTDDFEMQTRFAAVPGLRTVSIAVGVAMRVSGHRVELYRTPTGIDARIDGAPVTLKANPQALPNGGTVGTYGLDGSVTVVWPDGSVAIVQAVGVYPEYYRFTINLGLAPARVGHMVGLLGNPDGNDLNDLVTRSGQPVTYPQTPFAELYGTYVNSWRISQAESLLDYGPGQSTATFTDLTFPDAPATPQSLPTAARTSATNTCGLFGLTTPELRDACIVDVGLTGDGDFANSAAAAQASGLGIPSNTGGTAIGSPTTVTTTTGGENAVRTFVGTAGQKLTLTISGNTYSGADISVRDPNSQFVGSFFASAPTGYRDTFTLPVAGTYTIVVDPRDQQTGTLTFALASVPDNTGTTAIGTATVVVTTTIGENAVRTFTGTAGQKLTLTVLGNTYLSADISVRDPSQQFVASLFVSSATGFRDTFTLPVTGTYTFVVDPRDQQTGTLSFLLAAVPDNAGTTAIGTPTTVVTTTIGENAVRTFTGTAGQKLTLTVLANSYLSADIAVRDPSQQFVASLFVSSATGFRDTFTLPVTGTYTFVVDPRDQQTGTLSFLLAAVPDNTGTTAIGTPTTVVTTTIGENAVRTFVGTAGQKLTLTISGNTYSSVDITVRDPNGQFVASLFASSTTAFRDVFTLPVSGTYSILVDPRIQLTGTLTFLLADVAARAAAPANSSALAGKVASLRAGRKSALGAPAAAPNVGVAAAAAGELVLTIPVAELRANDRPGPANESAQSLTVTSVAATAATHGTVTLGNGVVTYTPDADFAGSASITYTACDDGTTAGQPDPRCANGTITVKVTANNPPTVDPKTVTTSEGTPVSLTLTGSDPDGEPIVFVIANAPGRGTLSGSAPILTYTPAPDANGVDTFTYTANDGHDQSVAATVTINVSEVNDPPVPQSDTVTTGVGQRVIVPVATLLANDDAGPFDESSQVLTVTTVTAGADTHGTVTLAAGSLTYDPDPGFSGTAVIGYTVCDDGTTNGQPDLRCASSTLAIGLNGRPTANDQSAQTARTAPIDFILSATDPEADALTYVITSPPQHGTLTGTAPTVTYTAAAGFIGNDAFSFTAADVYGASTPATVSILVKDVPASILQADAATVGVGTSVLIDVLANDAAGTGALDATTLAIASAPTRGAVVVETGRIRYTASGTTGGTDTFSYTACDSGGGCGTAVVNITITVNHAPTAAADSYDIAVGTTLHPSAPGVLANDADPDAGDRLQARLVRGVTNGNLLLNSTGAFTYTPNGPGIDTFVYHVLDPSGTVSNDATVTIMVTGPPGPPIVGNDLFSVQQGRALDVATPGVLGNDYSPNPRLGLKVLLQRDTAQGALLLQPDGTFVYTPAPGYIGIDQFSYVLRDSEGRVSQQANVGITVTGGGPPTAVVGTTTPAAGARLTGPTHFTASLSPPAGESVTGWTASYRRPGDATLVQLATGSGSAVAADFDPTTVRNGVYEIVIRAVTSGGGILVNETGVSVEGDYKPGRYATTYSDVAVNSANIPIDLLRTYDNTNKSAGDFGVGWTLDLAQFRIDSNGPIGGGGWKASTCGSFPFLATCYSSSKPHFVTVTWPDGHLERFRFAPNQGSQLLPSITTAGFVAEAGTTSTLAAVDDRLLLTGSDFLLGDFFSADGVYDPIQYVLTDASGTKYTLDRRTGLLAIVDRNGNTVSIGGAGVDSSSGLSMTFTRDADNRITRIGAPGGNIDYSYSAAGDLIGVHYPNGTDQTFTYDAHHDLLTTSGDGKLVRSVQYDASGRLTGITDAEGHTSTIATNVAGHQSVVTDATGQLTTVVSYDDRGDVIQRDRTAAGHTITTKATYDSVGRQLSNTDGLGHTGSQTYDAAGNVASQTDANGHTMTTTYNGFGQPLVTKDALGHTTANTYDSKGNLTATTDGNGQTTTYTYDADGNGLSTTDPAGRTTTRTYDANGQPLTITDAAGRVTHQTVDLNTGRVTSETDPTGAKTSFAYDAVGNLTSITDANGHARTAGYDGLDRVTLLKDPSGASVHQVYDAAGNLASVTDRNGQVTTYSYDAEARLLAKTVPGAGTTTFTYDAFGRRTAAVNDVARLTFTYDDADHVLAATSTPTAPNALPASTFTYTYDAAGNTTETQGPAGNTGYSYDANSQLATITDPASGAFDFGYDATGRQTSMTRPNGISDATSYNAAGDLISRHSTAGSTLVNQADYTYNAADLRSSVTTRSGTTTYSYDGASQLTSAAPPAAGGLPNEQYTYDAVGNRTSTATSPRGSFTYDSGNRLLGDATNTYAYDNEGNLLTRTNKASGARTSYTWTAEHELVGITYPDNTSSTFRYDPLGRRVEITDGATIARFAYDQQAIAAEYSSTNALAASYVHAGTEVTCPLEMVRGGQRYFYLADGLNSTTALTDLSGANAASFSYQAFGTPLRTGTLVNPFTYMCAYYVIGAGMFLPSSGPYDPRSGRFMNEDQPSFPNPNPYKGPPDDGGGSGRSGGAGAGGGGGAAEAGGGQCAGGSGPKIYPKGWKSFGKAGKKLMKYPKRNHPKKGAGNEYVALLPSQGLVQEVADYGFVLRCQIATAANGLAG